MFLKVIQIYDLKTTIKQVHQVISLKWDKIVRNFKVGKRNPSKQPSDNVQVIQMYDTRVCYPKRSYIPLSDLSLTY